MLKVTIDGREVEVEPGTTILRAAEKAGVEIPTFCYHEGLSIPANCRMCLVLTNKAPKLLPACHSQCTDGMEVHTNDERTLRTRRSVLELILLHHPVDCPICDQAGECVLQDHYFDHSAAPSRLFTRKGGKPKARRIGPNVMLDAERCINCTRCVRFLAEVTRTCELQVVHRGERSFITTFPGRALDNDYATNVVDLCPVGALTSRDFRFKKRVWFLRTAETLCGGCARGCNIHLDHSDGAVQRYRPRMNPEVNQWWMCDPGRLGYKALQADRIESATVGGRPVPLAEAIAEAAQALRHAAPGAVAVVPSLLSTNEDLAALAALCKSAGWGAWYVGGRADGKQDELLQRADRNPNRRGLESAVAAHGLAAKPLGELVADIEAGTVAAVLWIGHEHAAVEGLDLSGLAARVAVASNAAPILDGAGVVLPMRTHEEVGGTWTNFEGREQRLAPGPEAKGGVLPLLQVVERLAGALGKRAAAKAA